MCHQHRCLRTFSTSEVTGKYLVDTLFLGLSSTPNAPAYAANLLCMCREADCKCIPGIERPCGDNTELSTQIRFLYFSAKSLSAAGTKMQVQYSRLPHHIVEQSHPFSFASLQTGFVSHKLQGTAGVRHLLTEHSSHRASLGSHVRGTAMCWQRSSTEHNRTTACAPRWATCHSRIQLHTLSLCCFFSVFLSKSPQPSAGGRRATSRDN